MLERESDPGLYPESPANGSLTCSGTRYQDSCRLTCESGYKVGNEQDLHLHSLHSFTCMASGQWNDRPRCVPSDYCRLGLHDCHPEHGICDLMGHQTFRCRCRVGTVGDGRRCERTSCPPFPVAEPENGYFGCSIPASPAADFCQSPNSTAAEYEVVCLLHCNPGYDRLIYAEYSCGHDGNWTIPLDTNTTGTIPCLAVKCPNISSPLHGAMTCDSGYYFRYPEVCNFTCDRGYELTTPTSSSERRCQTDATWSGNDAVCIGVKCPDLSVPPNGRMTCNTSSLRYPDSTCTFSCNNGYELATPIMPVRHCQANATWSGDDATCIGVRCPALSAPANGRMTCNRGSSFRHPETCTFTCNHGYQLYTGSSRTCQADGAWTGSRPSSCNGGADIIFSIDVSGSVSGHFDTVRNFISGVVRSLSIGGSYARVGLIKFRFGQADMAISLTDYNAPNDKSALLARIGSLDTSFSSGVSSAAGLSAMRNEFSTSGRPAARKYGIVLTDGQDSSSSAVISDSLALRNDGTTIFCVGVAGWQEGMETFNNMASWPVNQHVFTAEFEHLQTIVDALPCPSGYASHQPSRSCYKAFNQESNYNGAKAICSSGGGTLAMPRDAVTNTFLINLKNAVDRNADFIFGLTDIRQEGRWVWEDGVALGGFSSWGPRQPSDRSNEDCVEYVSANYGDASFRNKWNVISCSYYPNNKFISCPRGYRSHQPSRSCYKAFNQKRDYNGAKATCYSDGGTLAMPRDAVTNTFLINLKNAVDDSAFFRFGLTLNRQEGSWVWEDGSALGTFRPWGRGLPNSAGGDEDCAEYLPRNHGHGTDTGYAYHQTSRSCYKAFNQWSNYNGARATCSSDGGTLAMPRDAVTNTFLINLKNAVDNSANFWFGLTDIRQEGRWVWEDGRVLGGFRSWYPGEPDNYGGNQDCGEYMTSANYRNKWNDERSCPSGYAYHPPSRLCYRAYDLKRNYNDAKVFCASDGGTLAMPRDDVTNSYLFNLKNAVDNSAFFRFGLTDILQEGRWVWEDGVALGYFSSWNPGEPNNLIYYNEDCAEYYPGSYGDASWNNWNDFPSCPSGYESHQYSRSCYKAYDQWSDYSNARATCASDGGTLAMPRDAATNTFLINLKNAVDLNTAFYFGLTLLRHVGRWVWEDGAALGGFRPWGINQPNDYLGNQDCGECTTPLVYLALASAVLKMNVKLTFPVVLFHLLCLNTFLLAKSVECPALTNPQNGLVVCSSRGYLQENDSCTFSCNPGYHLQVECGSDGQWAGTVPTCAGVKCPNISSPLHGRMICDSGYYFRYPEVCNFNCDWGYELTTPASSRERRCQTDATWSGNDAVCIVECPVLTSPQNGRVDCTDRLVNDRCTFSCNHGYHLLGSSQVVCGSDGQWTGTIPTCAACPSGYTYRQTNRLCYKAYNLERDYNGARATCASNGGTLAMPRDAATNTFLINLKNSVDLNTAFYFGLTLLRQEGRWVWEDGTALGVFHPWGPREPSDTGGNQDCVEYVSATWYEGALRNTWNDISCYYNNRKFICQVPPT
ncbi:hypothetical protein Bbelb_306990 [Branchiostoma belcheri]|nr:hypothetical protein Bbelb_306990 [Branchiostoma belcheri]